MPRLHKLVGIFVAGILVLIGGCKQESSTPVEPPLTSLPTYQPKGTITGLVKDGVTNVPVAGVVVSLGYDGKVTSTTSDAAGAFSFADVPAGQYHITDGSIVATGTYTMTMSFLNYNAAQSDANAKYRDYYYRTVTIQFTSLAPGDSLAVSDLVGAVVLNVTHLNTTLQGQVVDMSMQPVSGASVMLWDQTVTPNIVIGQASTDATGMYQFTHVDNGITVMVRAKSMDGSLQGALPFAFTLPANVNTDSLRSQVTIERLQILPVDDVNPYVITLTPENNADVSPSGLQIVYTFSEPIKQTPYTNTSLPVGHNTIVDDIHVNYNGMKKAAAEIGFSAQWNATMTQLTITPSGIVGSARYSLDATAALATGKLTDRAGNALVNNASIIGDFEVLNFTTAGGTTAPAAPNLTRRIISGVYNYLNFGGGAVGLEWNYDSAVRSYNIYRSVGNGPYEVLQKDFYGVQYATNSGSLVIPAGANDPLTSTVVHFAVTAVSKDLVESPMSNIITVGDDAKPQLITAGVAAAPGTNNWVFTLRFTEPLVVATAENAGAYSFGNTGGVAFNTTGASYLGFNAGQYIVQVYVTTNAALPVGYVLFVGNSVTDLAGNSIDPNANSHTF